MRREIKVVFIQAPQIGDFRQIRTSARSKLHRQVFENGLIRHDIDNHIDARVIGLETAEHVVIDFAFIAV